MAEDDRGWAGPGWDPRMPTKLFRFYKFEEVVAFLNVDVGCSSILGEWIERLWEGRVQEALEIA